MLAVGSKHRSKQGVLLGRDLYNNDNVQCVNARSLIRPGSLGLTSQACLLVLPSSRSTPELPRFSSSTKSPSTTTAELEGPGASGQWFDDDRRRFAEHSSFNSLIYSACAAGIALDCVSPYLLQREKTSSTPSASMQQ